MRKRVFILRHGETFENAKGIVQGSGIDSVLNETGVIQANYFYNTYKEIPFDFIVSSALQRSYQTIQLFEQSHTRILKDHRLNEIGWGEHEGKAGEPELMEKYHRIINHWKEGDYFKKCEGGESPHELKSRLSDFIMDLEQREFNQGLICTHGRTLRAMICLLKDWPLKKMEDVAHRNTGLYIAEFNKQKWEVVVENDLTHLEKLMTR